MRQVAFSSCGEQNINEQRPQNWQCLGSWEAMRNNRPKGAASVPGKNRLVQEEDNQDEYRSFYQLWDTTAKTQTVAGKAATMEPLWWIIWAAFYSELIAPPLRLYCCCDPDGGWILNNPPPWTKYKDRWTELQVSKAGQHRSTKIQHLVGK